ncbi:hypothetical protein BGW36DRAFT_288147, partial [Talaromyces proteolyticus]
TTPPMSESSTIFDAATACHHVFRMAKTAPRLMQQEWAENRLADFNVWSAGAGAFAEGKTSLDHRLGSNPEAHTILINLLLMLRILVQKFIDGGMGNSLQYLTPSSDHKIKDPAVELSSDELARMKDVEDSLNQLTRLTVAIRKAGNRPRLLKADSSFDPHSPQIRSLRRHLELLLLVHPGDNESSDSSARQLDPAKLTPIQLRLIDANLKRRNRFLYAQQHAQKLGLNSEYPKNTRRESPLFVKQQSRSGVDKTTSLSQRENTLTKADIQTQSTTTATLVDEPIVVPPSQFTNSATTVISVTSSRVSYPKSPPIYDHHNIFRCPCCCQALPAAVGRGNQWKDILPYTCVIEDCPRTDTFYIDKETWLSHMNKGHGGTDQWVCHACSQKNINATFRELANFTAHLEHQHSNGIRLQQIPMLCSAWRRKVPLEISACPLCSFEGEDQNALLDHTAEHIHSFSLRSLPWAPRDSLEEEDDEEEKEEARVYFKQHSYFDVDSCQSERPLSPPGVSSLDTDPGGIGSSDSTEVSNSMQEQQELTEHLLNQVPHATLGQESMSDWLEMLSNDPENPNPLPPGFRTMLDEFANPPEDTAMNRRALGGEENPPGNKPPETLTSFMGRGCGHRRCSGCDQEVRKFDSISTMYWYCCNCRDGPNSLWMEACV